MRIKQKKGKGGQKHERNKKMEKPNKKVFFF